MYKKLPCKMLEKMAPVISSTFYEQLLRQYSVDKKLQSQTISREKLDKTLS
jgi:hypothetical protein